ncbi:MAG: 4-oxalocrotonate tautomerase [Actinomycetota bacterium]|nr:4-oxalocrotonate tautomerase [Actinomycetota bacterium]
MPMIDLTYPDGALEPERRAEAVERLTAALLQHEGAADNEQTRAMSWTVVHELPAGALNVGGTPAERPVYRVLITVPEGTMLQGPGPIGTHSRRNLVREVAEILLAAEGTEYSDAEACRVYCLVREVSDGYWGGMGTTFRIEDIVATATPEAPQTAVSERARAAIGELVAERSGAAA